MRGAFDRSCVAEVIREKQQVIRKSGVLEFVEPDVSFDDVGGLANLKAWFRMRREAFSPDGLTLATASMESDRSDPTTSRPIERNMSRSRPVPQAQSRTVFTRYLSKSDRKNSRRAGFSCVIQSYRSAKPAY